MIWMVNFAHLPFVLPALSHLVLAIIRKQINTNKTGTLRQVHKLALNFNGLPAFLLRSLFDFTLEAVAILLLWSLFLLESAAVDW